MTPERARELVEEHGSIRAAARAAGMSFSGFYRYVNPERTRELDRARQRRYLDRNALAYSRKTLRSRRYEALRRGRKPIDPSLFLNSEYAYVLLGKE